MRPAVQVRPPRLTISALFRRLEPQEITREVVKLLAILAQCWSKSVVIDHADLLREPLRPALRAHALLDLVADGAGQQASGAFTRHAAANARDVGPFHLRTRPARTRGLQRNAARPTTSARGTSPRYAI